MSNEKSTDELYSDLAVERLFRALANIEEVAWQDALDIAHEMCVRDAQTAITAKELKRASQQFDALAMINTIHESDADLSILSVQDLLSCLGEVEAANLLYDAYCVASGDMQSALRDHDLPYNKKSDPSFLDIDAMLNGII